MSAKAASRKLPKDIDDADMKEGCTRVTEIPTAASLVRSIDITDNYYGEDWAFAIEDEDLNTSIYTEGLDSPKPTPFQRKQGGGPTLSDMQAISQDNPSSTRPSSKTPEPEPKMISKVTTWLGDTELGPDRSPPEGGQLMEWKDEVNPLQNRRSEKANGNMNIPERKTVVVA
ncbi:hypothetical protein BC829DRAFT_493420 [Chytridium lagenaria]|nr:hypothetical protein BC829DRAFT_493420 [Chytridium lagenaria]